MAERPTTIRLGPEIEAAVRELASDIGLTFNATLKLLVAEALDARGRHPKRTSEASRQHINPPRYPSPPLDQ